MRTHGFALLAMTRRERSPSVIPVTIYLAAEPPVSRLCAEKKSNASRPLDMPESNELGVTRASVSVRRGTVLR